ncbi:MAG: hypothetical protein R3D02_00115 [Hyphomicrobiales bacterium]
MKTHRNFLAAGLAAMCLAIVPAAASGTPEAPDLASLAAKFASAPATTVTETGTSLPNGRTVADCPVASPVRL